jgi:hypothetical protein
MALTDLRAGDRVGIKDSGEFTHWSRRGSIADVTDGPDGSPVSLSVTPDGALEAVPMLPELLVKLGGATGQGGSDEWIAQAYPINGDAPGIPMYFANGADVLAFVAQFQALQLDETLKVHAPAAASDAERLAVKHAGAVDL